MSEREPLIPPFHVVQTRLADNLREARLLRRQLRLSMEASQLRAQRAAGTAAAARAVKEGGASR